MVLKALKIVPFLAGTFNQPFLEQPRRANDIEDTLSVDTPSFTIAPTRTYNVNTETGKILTDSLWLSTTEWNDSLDGVMKITIQEFQTRYTEYQSGNTAKELWTGYDSIFGLAIKYEHNTSYRINTSFEFWNEFYTNIYSNNQLNSYANCRLDVYRYTTTSTATDHLINIRTDNYILNTYKTGNAVSYGQAITKFLLNGNEIGNNYNNNLLTRYENITEEEETRAIYISDLELQQTYSEVSYEIYYCTIVPNTEQWLGTSDNFRLYSNQQQYINFHYYGNELTAPYEVIDIPGLMFHVLTMPFTFISMAFNLTLFPYTPYQINISNLFLTIIGLLVFIFIIKQFIKRS